jgi:rubrerythrin
MTIMTPTHGVGATGTPTEMTVIPPDRAMVEASFERFAAGTSYNRAFLADLLSSFLAHEQCGVHLYRTVAGATANPMLQGRYRQFLGQTEEHVRILEELIGDLGGNPFYVSPSARLVHAMNTGLLQGVVLAAGSGDILHREMAMLEAVVLAETKDHADWSLLATLAADLPDGAEKDVLRRAVERVQPEEDEHVTWAKDMWTRMAKLQVESTTMMKIADMTERAFAAVKNAVSGS